MILDRLGVLTDEVSSNLTEALDWAADRALKHVEVRMIDSKNVMDLTDDQVERVRREVEQRGLFVSAVASPVFKCALDPYRPVASGDTFGQKEENVDAHFAKLSRAIQTARILGTNRIRIFSFWREREPSEVEMEVVRHLKDAAAIAEKEQMLLLLENEPSCNGGYADEVGRLVRVVDSPAMKVLWDPGNEVYGGRLAFPEGYDQVKDVLGHVHLKDALVDEDGKSSCVPIRSGKVPFIEQFKALSADGYTGLFTIETHHIPKGGTAMDGTELTLNALRELVEEAKLG
jgi:L-ribulose-5-phosphate 3-epimerase